MEETKSPAVITESQVEGMMKNRDFSSVEGNVPEFIACLLKLSPVFMKSALDIALQNQEILRETQEYIHRTSDKVLKEYTEVANLEQKSLANTNKDLSSILVSLCKKENMSANDVDIYFQTLQEIERNNVRMDENRKETAQFLGEVQENQIINTQPKNHGHIAAKAVLDMLQTPHGSKMAVEAVLWIAKSLYKAYTK